MTAKDEQSPLVNPFRPTWLDDPSLYVSFDMGPRSFEIQDMLVDCMAQMVKGDKTE